MNVSIIIPCFNEEKTISEIIHSVKKNINDNDEIIVIDDYSTDKTRDILEGDLKNKINNLILNEKNFGKGYSIRKGIEKSKGDIILIQDADLEYSPTDYKILTDPIKNGYADVVFGSRFIGSQQKRVLYFWHTVGNKFLTILSNMFTNLNLTDMECCYKVFKKDVIKKLVLKENRFGIEPEITAKISKQDIKIYEVGVKYFGRKYNEGKKISWKDGFAAIKCIIIYNLFN